MNQLEKVCVRVHAIVCERECVCACSRYCVCKCESACVHVHASVRVRVPVPCGEEGDTKKLAAKQKIKSFPLSLAPQVFDSCKNLGKKRKLSFVRLH